MDPVSVLRRAARKVLPAPVKRVVKKTMGLPVIPAPGTETSAQYWTRVNVTGHHQFRNAADSLEFFHWRNAQYHRYIDVLMPVTGRDGEVVLDYGCGPGHDVVGFACFSNPRRLIAMDVSPTSLAEAQARLALHGKPAEFMPIPEKKPIPLADASVDYIHSSGVLHHIADLPPVLRELRRILKPSGQMRVMIYNYESVFLHLYTAYLVMIEEGRYPGETVREAFRHLTDGPDCPVSRAYTPAEFITLLHEAGFAAQHAGNSVSMFEMKLLPRRFDAIQDRRLPREHREFLCQLKQDADGFPLHAGAHAGIDGCFRATRKP